VIVGVNGLNLNPFLEFARDMAVEAASDPALLEEWLGPQVRRNPQPEAVTRFA
jgi:hypothetical protein